MDFILLTVILVLQVFIIYKIYFFRKKDSGQEDNLDNQKLLFDNLAGKILIDLKDTINQSFREQENIQNNLLSKNEAKFSELLTILKDKLSELNTSLLAGLHKIQIDSQEFNKNQELLSKQNSTSQQASLMDLQNKLLEQQSKIYAQLQKVLLSGIERMQLQNTENLKTLTDTTQKKLDRINLEVNQRLDNSFAQHLKSFENVTQAVGKIQALTVRMIDSTSAIDKLNSVFERTSSKAFGTFSEKYLESMLSEHLSGKSYVSQYQIPGTNNKIDFVLSFGTRKIGIDSKFPLARYQDFLQSTGQDRINAKKALLREVLTQAKSISAKYGNASLDVLLMYLPSDGLYSEIVTDEILATELQKLKVTPASPNTIFPLIVLMQSLQLKKKVSEQAENIMSGLSVISKNIQAFQNEFRKMGDKLRQAQQNYDTADRNLVIVNNSILKLKSSDTPEDENLLKPQEQENTLFKIDG